MAEFSKNSQFLTVIILTSKVYTQFRIDYVEVIELKSCVHSIQDSKYCGDINRKIEVEVEGGDVNYCYHGYVLLTRLLCCYQLSVTVLLPRLPCCCHSYRAVVTVTVLLLMHSTVLILRIPCCYQH